MNKPSRLVQYFLQHFQTNRLPLELRLPLDHCRLVLPCFMFCVAAFASIGLQAKNKQVALAKMMSDDTRYYSHLHWQDQPGAGLAIKLLPSINATGKTAYDIRELSGKDHHSEVRTIPNALDQVLFQLVHNSQFLTPSTRGFDYYLQFHIQQYDTLYALGDSNHDLSLGFGHIDRAWSQIHGDDKPAEISLTLVLYNRQQQPVLEVPVTAELDACARSGQPMTFSPDLRMAGEATINQTFFDGFATTTTGQTFIAAANRTLEQVNQYFDQRPIHGTVIKVDQNEIYLNLGEGIVYKNERLDLLYEGDKALGSYPVSRLEVEQVQQNSAIAHALDMHSANVLAGDRVRLNKTTAPRKAVSFAGEAIGCSEQNNAMADADNNNHWWWQSDE